MSTNYVAPNCPISKSQLKTQGQGNPATFTTPPIATDIDSLIAAVNALREILLQFQGQWTVNNIHLPNEPNHRKEGNTYYSQYPEWQEVGANFSIGFVYHKDADGMDRTQAAFVTRVNQVTFKNRMQNDPDFNWSYSKKLDAEVSSG